MVLQHRNLYGDYGVCCFRAYIFRDDIIMKLRPRKYAENREEYIREFHRVIAPVIVLKMEDKEDTINKTPTELDSGNRN